MVIYAAGGLAVKKKKEYSKYFKRYFTDALNINLFKRKEFTAIKTILRFTL